MGFNDMTATIGLDSKPFEAGMQRVKSASDQFRKRWEANDRRMSQSRLFNRFERTNLTSQGIDIASGLASGQRPLTILLQQGGQVMDLLIRRDGGLKKAFSDVGKAAIGMAAGLGPVGAALAAIAASVGASLFGFYKVAEARGQEDDALAALERFNDKRRALLLAENERQFKAQIISDEKYAAARSKILSGKLGEASRFLGFDGDKRDAEIADRIELASFKPKQELEFLNVEQAKAESMYSRGIMSFESYQSELLRILEARHKKEREMTEIQAEELRRRIRESNDEVEKIKLGTALARLLEENNLRDIRKTTEVDSIQNLKPTKPDIFRPQTDALSAIGGGTAGTRYYGSMMDQQKNMLARLDAIDRTLKGTIRVAPAVNP